MAKKTKHKYQQLPNYDIDEEASITAAKGKKDQEQEEENTQYHDCSDDKTIKHQNSFGSKSFKEQRKQQQARSLSQSSDNSSIASDSSASHHTKRVPSHASTDRQGGSTHSSGSKESSAGATSTYSGSGSRSGGSSSNSTRKQVKRDRIKDHVKKMILPYKEKDTNPRPKVTPLEADPYGGRAAAVAHNKIHRRRSPAINIMGETEDDINGSLVKQWNKAEEKVILANIAPALTGEQILSLQEENPGLIQVLQPSQDEILFNDAVREQRHGHSKKQQKLQLRQQHERQQQQSNNFDLHRKKHVTLSNSPTFVNTPATAKTTHAPVCNIDQKKAASTKLQPHSHTSGKDGRTGSAAIFRSKQKKP